MKTAANLMTFSNRWGCYIVDDIGLDLIKDALGQALARGAHPRRI
jgi:hypothetical protein